MPYCTEPDTTNSSEERTFWPGAALNPRFPLHRNTLYTLRREFLAVLCRQGISNCGRKVARVKASLLTNVTQKRFTPCEMWTAQRRNRFLISKRKPTSSADCTDRNVHFNAAQTYDARI